MASASASPAPADAPTDLDRGFFATAPGCILLVDAETGTIRAANAACADWTGYLREELVGMSLPGLTAPEDRRDRAAGALDRARERGEPLRMDVSYLRKDGRTVWGAMAMTPLAGEDGRVGTVVVQIDDLTEFRRSDSDRRLADLRFRRLVEEIPAAVFALPLGPGTAVSYLSPRIAELTGHEPADLEGSRRFLEPFIHPDDAPTVRARRDEAERTLQPYAVRFRLRRADGAWAWLDERGMVVRDELGVPRYWQGILVDAGAEMAGREALADSEARHRGLVDHLPNAIFLSRSADDVAIVYASPGLESMLGYRPEEAVGDPAFLFDRIHPDDAAAKGAIARAIRAGEPWRGEYRLRTADGGWRWVRNDLVPVRDASGRPSHWQGVLTDLQPERESAAGLAASEALFRSAFDDSALGIMIEGADGTVIDANPAVCAMLGRSRDEVAGHAWRDLLHPDSIPDAEARAAQLAAGQVDAYQDERRYLRADGTSFLARITVSAIRDDRGALDRVVFQVEDIGAAREAERALVASEARFRALVQGSTDATMIARPEGGAVWVSPAIRNILGIDLQPPIDVAVADLVHPDDTGELDRMRREVRAAPDATCTIELRARHADGTWRWLEILGTNHTGNPAVGGIVYNIRDVSERKAAEQRTAEREAFFRTFFEGARIGMATGTPDATLIDVNPAFCRLLGRTREELVGRSFLEFTHPDDVPENARQYAAMASGETDGFTMDKRYLRADGSEMWVRVSLAPIRRADGTMERAVAQVEDISAEKAAQQALLESQATVRSIVEDAASGLGIVDADGRLLEVNPAFCRLVGYTREELRSLTFADLTHPDDLPGEMDLIAEMRAGERDSYRLDKRYLRKDGGTVWVRANVSCVRGPGGRIERLVGQLEDITAEMAALAALAESEARLSDYFEHAAAGIAAVDLDGRMRKTNPAFRRMLGYAEDELDALTFQQLTHPDDLPAALATFRRLLAGEAEGDVVETRMIRKNGETVWTRSNAAVVRGPDGEAAGVFAQVEDVSDVKTAVAALAESEALFRSSFENARVSMILAMPEGVILDVNPATCRFLGRDRDWLVGRHFREITHPDDVETSVENYGRTVAGEIPGFSLEKRYLRADGSAPWGRLNIASVRGEDGRATLLLAQIEDIDARKAAERALAESEAQFRSVFEDSAIGTTIADEDGRFLAVNPAFCAMLGRAPEELVGVRYDEITHPDDLGLSIEAAARLNAGEIDSYHVEKRYLHRDGHPVWCRLNVSCVREPDGRMVRKISQVEDITARIEAERRYRRLVEQIPAAVFIKPVDPAAPTVFISPRIEEITGYRPEELMGEREFLRRLAHPDDVEAGMARVRASDRSLEPCVLQYRIRRRDGRWIWLLDSSEVVRDESGQPLHWQGLLLDITAQKEAERALAASEALFRSVFDGAAIGMTVLDPDHRFLDLNPAMCRMLGYERDELLGLTPDDVTHPDDLPTNVDSFRRWDVDRPATQALEKRYLRKDGTIVWTRLNVAAIRRPDGTIERFIGQVEDITARKAAEAALAESEALFRSTFDGAAIGMAVRDPRQRFLDVNPAVCRMFGYERDELLGLTPDDVTHPDDLMANAVAFLRWDVDRPATQTFEKRFLRKDGTVLWARLNVASIRRPDGGVERLVGQIEDITARKVAEAALAESEAHLREIFVNAAVGIMSFDAAGRILETNPALQRMLGYTADELTDMTGTDITHPDDVPVALGSFRRVISGEIDHDVVEFRVRRRDGGIAWIRANAACLRGPDSGGDRVLAQVEDISAVRLAQQALADSEQRFRALVERSTDMKVIADADGTVRWASPAARDILGVEPERLAGASWLRLLHPDDLAEATERFERLRATSGVVVRSESRVRHADGSWRWVEVIGANEVENPAVAGVVYNIRDISERKEAERATAEALELQRRANDELVALGQQRSEFLAMLAHDFRTPLTSIQGYSELLAMGAGSDPEVAADAGRIHDSAVRLNHMVEDMLTVETLEKRLGQLDLRPTDLGRLLRDAVDAAAGAAGNREVTVDVQPGLPEVMVDRDQLTRAVVNLVGNALKYSPDGSAVRIAAGLVGDRVEIAVSDDGFGIPADRLETIFDKYDRVRTAETAGIAGVGLGLPIVRAIARAHGGEAWAESERGVGSTFRLAVPAGA